MVTAYAVLRPDTQGALLMVNKDESSSDSVSAPVICSEAVVRVVKAHVGFCSSEVVIASITVTVEL